MQQCFRLMNTFGYIAESGFACCVVQTKVEAQAYWEFGKDASRYFRCCGKDV